MKFKKYIQLLLFVIISLYSISTSLNAIATDSNTLGDKLTSIKDTTGLELIDVTSKFSSIQSVSKAGDDVIFCGRLSEPESNNGSVAIRYDKNSNEVWSISLYGDNSVTFYNAKETLDKGVIVIGSSSSTNIGYSHKGKTDAIIIKYDKHGNQEWIKGFGGTEDDYFVDVVEDDNGNFIVAGSSKSTDAGYANKGKDDFVIIKLTSRGDVLWQTSFGGSETETISSMIIENNRILIAGSSRSFNAGFVNKGGADSIILSYDLEGNLLDVKSYGDSSSDIPNKMIKTSDNQYVLAVNAEIFAYLIKINENLEAIDTYYISEAGYEYYIQDFIESYDGNFFITGYKVDENWEDTSAFLIKCDKNGNKIWTKQEATSDDFEIFEKLIELDYGMILAVGRSDNYNTGTSSSLILTAELDYVEGDRLVKIAEFDKTKNSLNNARDFVNKLKDNIHKSNLQGRLDSININLELERKNATANLDIYIKSENMLSMSLSTNSVTFENYSGVEDAEMLGAVNLTVNSSLPYKINAYMPTEISNSDGSETMPIDVLNIKEGNETNYQTFESITDKVVLKDNCEKGNGNIHSIDMKLSSNQAHKADIYKTVIKFEAQQK